MNSALLALLGRALGETLLMVIFSSGAGWFFGLPLGVALYMTSPRRMTARPWLHHLLGAIVNLGRSVPFIILLMAIIPLTRLLTGTSIGVWAAIVPLAVGAVPFVARLVEGALQEVPASLVEVARSLGASSGQVVSRVLLPEAAAGLAHGATLTLVTSVNYSAMAGAVGGGGLGDVGIRYGYQRFDVTTMLLVVSLLVALVQTIQFAGSRIGRMLDRRD